METSEEILCISGLVRNYAVEFKYIKEICSDILVSKVPVPAGIFCRSISLQRGYHSPNQADEEADIPSRRRKKLVLILASEIPAWHYSFQEPFMVQEQKMTRWRCHRKRMQFLTSGLERHFINCRIHCIHWGMLKRSWSI